MTFELVEFARDGASPSHLTFERTVRVTGGVPLDVSLRDLLLELPDGRKVAIDVVSLKRDGLRETYAVRGMLHTRPDAGTQPHGSPATS